MHSNQKGLKLFLFLITIIIIKRSNQGHMILICEEILHGPMLIHDEIIIFAFMRYYTIIYKFYQSIILFYLMQQI